MSLSTLRPTKKTKSQTSSSSSSRFDFAEASAAAVDDFFGALAGNGNSLDVAEFMPPRTGSVSSVTTEEGNSSADSVVGTTKTTDTSAPRVQQMYGMPAKRVRIRLHYQHVIAARQEMDDKLTFCQRIGEGIDNSEDAGATIVDIVLLGAWVERLVDGVTKQVMTRCIVLTDNGKGLTEQTFMERIATMGAQKLQQDTNTMGRFGVGHHAYVLLGMRHLYVSQTATTRLLFLGGDDFAENDEACFLYVNITMEEARLPTEEFKAKMKKDDRWVTLLMITRNVWNDLHVKKMHPLTAEEDGGYLGEHDDSLSRDACRVVPETVDTCPITIQTDPKAEVEGVTEKDVFSFLEAVFSPYRLYGSTQKNLETEAARRAFAQSTLFDMEKLSGGQEQRREHGTSVFVFTMPKPLVVVSVPRSTACMARSVVSRTANGARDCLSYGIDVVQDLWLPAVYFFHTVCTKSNMRFRLAEQLDAAAHEQKYREENGGKLDGFVSKSPSPFRGDLRHVFNEEFTDDLLANERVLKGLRRRKKKSAAGENVLWETDDEDACIVAPGAQDEKSAGKAIDFHVLKMGKGDVYVGKHRSLMRYMWQQRLPSRWNMERGSIGFTQYVQGTKATPDRAENVFGTEPNRLATRATETGYFSKDGPMSKAVTRDDAKALGFSRNEEYTLATILLVELWNSKFRDTRTRVPDHVLKTLITSHRSAFRATVVVGIIDETHATRIGVCDNGGYHVLLNGRHLYGPVYVADNKFSATRNRNGKGHTLESQGMGSAAYINIEIRLEELPVDLRRYAASLFAPSTHKDSFSDMTLTTKVDAIMCKLIPCFMMELHHSGDKLVGRPEPIVAQQAALLAELNKRGLQHEGEAILLEFMKKNAYNGFRESDRQKRAATAAAQALAKTLWAKINPPEKEKQVQQTGQGQVQTGEQPAPAAEQETAVAEGGEQQQQQLAEAVEVDENGRPKRKKRQVVPYRASEFDTSLRRSHVTDGHDDEEVFSDEEAGGRRRKKRTKHTGPWSAARGGALHTCTVCQREVTITREDGARFQRNPWWSLFRCAEGQGCMDSSGNGAHVPEIDRRKMDECIKQMDARLKHLRSDAFVLTEMRKQFVASIEGVSNE